MSCSGKVSRKFEFLRVFGAAEKIQAKVSELLRKIKKKLKLIALASQQNSVEMFCFARKTKIHMLTTSSWSLTRIHQRFLKFKVL